VITFNEKINGSKATAKPQGLCGQVDCFVRFLFKYQGRLTDRPFNLGRIQNGCNGDDKASNSFNDLCNINIHLYCDV